MIIFAFETALLAQKCGLNEMALRYSSTWFLVGGTVLGRLGCVALLEEACRWRWTSSRVIVSPYFQNLFAIKGVISLPSATAAVPQNGHVHDWPPNPSLTAMAFTNCYASQLLPNLPTAMLTTSGHALHWRSRPQLVATPAASGHASALMGSYLM